MSAALLTKPCSTRWERSECGKDHLLDSRCRGYLIIGYVHEDWRTCVSAQLSYSHGSQPGLISAASCPPALMPWIIFDKPVGSTPLHQRRLSWLRINQRWPFPAGVGSTNEPRVRWCPRAEAHVQGGLRGRPQPDAPPLQESFATGSGDLNKS